MFNPSRGGTRGGKDQFSWDDVKADKHRENYLGHSLMAPLGRWQKGKDLQWYSKKRGRVEQDNSEKDALERLKEQERQMLMEQAGIIPKKPRNSTGILEKSELTEVLQRGKVERDDKMDVERIGGLGYGAPAPRHRDLGVEYDANNQKTVGVLGVASEPSDAAKNVSRSVNEDFNLKQGSAAGFEHASSHGDVRRLHNENKDEERRERKRRKERRRRDSIADDEKNENSRYDQIDRLERHRQRSNERTERRQIRRRSPASSHRRRRDNRETSSNTYKENIELVVDAAASLSSDEWNYDHPERWPGSCGNGKMQSPIDLNLAIWDKKFRNLHLTYTETNVTLINNGHTLQIVADRSDMFLYNVPTLERDAFQLAHCHFHWGAKTARMIDRFAAHANEKSSNKSGSEHSLHGEYFDAEVHCVHFNSKYRSMSAALKYKDGIAVIASFFRTGKHCSALHDVFDRLSSVEKWGTHTTGVKINIRKIYSKNATTHFYYYNGSLTTPECNEVVTWIISRQVNEMSSNQLQQLRDLRDIDNNPIEHNNRPIQKQNSRYIFASFDDSLDKSDSSVYRHESIDS